MYMLKNSFDFFFGILLEAKGARLFGQHIKEK